MAEPGSELGPPLQPQLAVRVVGLLSPLFYSLLQGRTASEQPLSVSRGIPISQRCDSQTPNLSLSPSSPAPRCSPLW